MVTNCCICKSVWGNGLSFHRFPKMEARREQWLTEINRHIENFTLPAQASVCCQHFSNDSFVVTYTGKIYLKSNAVPTIFNMPLKTCLKIKKPLQECNSFHISHEKLSTKFSTTNDTIHSEALDIPIIERKNINIHQQQSHIEKCHISANTNCNKLNLETIINEESQNNSHKLPAFMSNKGRVTKFGTAQSSSLSILTTSDTNRMTFNKGKTITKLKRKVKVLQQKCRRLQKRVISMSLFIKHLQDRKSFSKVAARLL